MRFHIFLLIFTLISAFIDRPTADSFRGVVLNLFIQQTATLTPTANLQIIKKYIIRSCSHSFVTESMYRNTHC